MKRILVFISMLLCLSAAVFGQGCPWPPHGGDNNTPPPPIPGNTPLDGTETSGGISADPNEIIGPMGYDSIHWVSINELLNYTILFENDPEFATANAQKVDVRFRFEDKAQMKGFSLGMYGFANMSWPIEDAPAAFQNRLDLRDSMHIYVDLVAGLDVVKQEAFWTFNSIDPETGWNPWQVDRGMLPVNDSTHVGEGFLKFQLKPNPNMETGDTISFAANIVFDQNDTIPTNRWCVTIDAGMPTSKVNGRKDSKNDNLYHLTLQAADDEGGSGLKRVVLYQANNFGIYEEFAVCPLDTVIDFIAEPGKRYSFYSLAEDNVGNVEPLKELADLEINANASPTDIVLTDSIFQDDILIDGFIAELSSVDAEEDGSFTYELAEGDGAIHNEYFKIEGSQLLAKNSFKCATDTIFNIRISTKDEGGLSFSKAFHLYLENVLEKPKPDTLIVNVCEGESFLFHGNEYDKTGIYRFTKSNDYMCDSIYVLQLTVMPHLEVPTVTVEGGTTLVSSAAKGNQWFRSDGTKIEGATEQKFTPTEDGIYYVAVYNGSCYSEPSNSFRVMYMASSTLNLELQKGWNWISSNLTGAEFTDAMSFIKPIENNVDRLVGFQTELFCDPQLGFVGQLKELNPATFYQIQVNNIVNNTWTGNAYRADETPIAIRKGWNWMGYIPACEFTVEKALEKMEPMEGDVVKNYELFAVFNEGEWKGTLSVMQPGEGYMYYSGKQTTFFYPSSQLTPVVDPAQLKVAYGAMESDVIIPWEVAKHVYPYNMTMIAQVFIDGHVISPGLYTIGAFVGNECRGIGRYVDDKLFMTIYGEINSGDRISFKAYDNETQQEYNIVEGTVFSNSMLGTINSPYKLTIDKTTGIKEMDMQNFYNIYPNPVRNVMYISGDLKHIQSVSVITNNGVVMAKTESYTEKGLNVSHLSDGTYIVVLRTDSGIITKKMVKIN